jgi:exonuclease SbcC
MRPLALRLQAFGSYAGELEVDFARLGRHGVFSITGPTGAGKSTIFDAIVYALYDDLPGFRVKGHIRSQYAEPDTPTKVTFEFEADGREWVVERSPAQLRARKIGEGEPVADASRVTLNEKGADGGAVTRKTAVDDRLTELVGLSKAQFEQVVLIPQGRFEEVLKAETSQRAALLGRLFPVDMYKQTTVALKELAASRIETYNTLVQEHAELVDRVRRATEAAIEQVAEDTPSTVSEEALGPEGFEVTRIEDYRAEVARLLALVQASLARADVEQKGAQAKQLSVEAQIQRWDTWQEDLTTVQSFADQETTDEVVAQELARARAVATLAAALTAWRDATTTMAILEADRTRLLTSIDDAWVDTYDRAGLTRATSAMALATTIQGDADALETADAIYRDLRQREGELAATATDLTTRAATLEEATATHAENTVRLVAIRGQLETAAEQAKGRDAAEPLVQKLQKELQTAQTRASTTIQVEKLTGEIAKAVGAENDARSWLGAVRASWRAGLAGRLAEHLGDGDPCPTCGSTEHPALAVVTADAPSDEALEAAEVALDEASRARQALDQQLAQAQGTLGTLAEGDDPAVAEGRLNEAKATLASIITAEAEHQRLTAEVGQLAATVEAQGKQLDQDARDLEVERATLDEKKRTLGQERDTFVAAHGSLTSTEDATRYRRGLASAVEQLATVLTETETASSAQSHNLSVLSPTVAEFGLTDPTGLEGWARTTEEIAQAERELAARRDHRRDVKKRVDEYAASGAPKDRPDATPLIQAAQQTTEKHNDLVGRVAVMNSQLETIDDARDNLTTTATAIDAARRSKEEAETLADTCAGAGAGPVGTKLSLENWVLAYYLRQVLAQANRRLDTMTGGRFALELSREYTDGRKPWGLDLSVLDAETGQSRPATTLSGGETFKAALSLALGLADVVSAGSNYTIGALFVDEGFGSLDEDSLDTVIDVLRSLEDGGRMVGVISHVQDLKTALPNGITVDSTNHGSEATINYPDA